MTQKIVRRLISSAILYSALIFTGSSVLAQVNVNSYYPNDIRPGSILFFNRYTSNPNNPQQGDTQLNITNVSQSLRAELHLFLVDGATCTVADFFLSLTQNQTSSFLLSDYDPGVQGYIVAVATNGGTPAQFNNLIGTVYIRETDGRTAVLPAISFLKRSPGEIQPKQDGSYSLLFNGIEYEQFPSSVAISSFNSQVTDQGSLVLISPTSDLTFGAVNQISIFTLLYDDTEKSFSSSLQLRCYLYSSLTNLFNRGGSITRQVPAGRTGWIRMSATSPLIGSFIIRGPVFSGGHNLHTLALLPSYEITLPVF